ncbi:hypothetical protein [Halomonas daqiaonensis]|uniref:Uncharacterized protein n=1 Tax=Halomonas daqiaonensis TaxID=650850 RepID=A0A1H7QXL5_9GAMM|nr:hypothetical protein [Halomonas daqiaonensis]SEL52458.1 hypothetical protein SAMN04488129_11178 [Halomonas daqiaonensis]
MKYLLPAVVALLIPAAAAHADWPHPLVWSCDKPGTDLVEPQWCYEQGERQPVVDTTKWLVEESADWLEKLRAPPPVIPTVPHRSAQAYYIELLSDGEKAKTPLGPNTLSSTEIDTIVHGVFPPDANILGDDVAITQLPIFMWLNSAAAMPAGDWRNPCGRWLRGGLAQAFGSLAAERLDGVDVADRWLRMGTGFHPYLDLSLHTPWDFDGSGEEDPGCQTEAGFNLSREITTADLTRALGQPNALFFTRLAGLVYGGAGHLDFELNSLLQIARSLPPGIQAEPDRLGVVQALDRTLRTWFPRGLYEAYPTVAAGFTRQIGGQTRGRVFFTEEAPIRAALGETIASEVVVVRPLATELFTVFLPAAPDHRVRIEVEVEPVDAAAVRDVHLLVNGKPRRDHFNLPRWTKIVESVPKLSKIYVAAAAAPESLDSLEPEEVRVKVTLTSVGECTPDLMTAMTNPRSLEAIGQMGDALGLGDGDMPGKLMEMLGALTGANEPADPALSPATGELSIVIGGREAGGAICADPLAAVQRSDEPSARDVALSFYTPGPSATMNTYDAMIVAHDGWEGWPANAQLQLHLRLPGVAPEELEAGSSYPARLLGLQRTGFFPIWSRYEGEFHPYFPYQEAFTGWSEFANAGPLAGTVWIDTIEGGRVSGRLLLEGEAEMARVEHTMEETGEATPSFSWEGEVTMEPVSIEAEFTIPAQEEGRQRMRGGVFVRPARVATDESTGTDDGSTPSR